MNKRRSDLEAKTRQALKELNDPRVDDELVDDKLVEMIVKKILLVDRMTTLLNGSNPDVGLHSTQVMASVITDMITSPLYSTENQQ